MADLAGAIWAGITWDDLPTVGSGGLFRSAWSFLLGERQQGRALSTIDELFRSFAQANPDVTDDESRAAFAACIERIESEGLIRRLHFGGLVLLQAELLDDHAQTMLLAARARPGGLGSISEYEALTRQLGRADEESSSDPAQPGVLRIAAVEELLRQEIVLREAGEREATLTFPSEVTMRRPDFPGVQLKVTFAFEGAPQAVYARLAVRLAHSGLFLKAGLWRDTAVYGTAGGGMCGVYLGEPAEGRGELNVFCDERAAPGASSHFEAYVADYLDSMAVPGTRYRIPACEVCDSRQDAAVVRRMLDRGGAYVFCSNCGSRISLLDEEPSADTVAAVAEMKRNAEEQRDREVTAMQLRGKAETADFDVYLCYNAKDRDAVMAIGDRLKERGILPWLDIWEIRPGLRWQEHIERSIESIKSAAVFIGSGGAAPWRVLETEAVLKRFAADNRPVIPVLLEGNRGSPRLPVYMRSRHLVDLRDLTSDPFDELVREISASGPGQPPEQ
jgi:hypothetical protein